jgi:hypothetical protein
MNGFTVPPRLFWVKSSRGLSAVAERRWKLARQSVPGAGGKNETGLKGQGKSGVLSGRMNSFGQTRSPEWSAIGMPV